MKNRSKIISIMLLVVFLGGLLAWGQAVYAAPEHQVQFVAPRLVVNSSFLNVRSGPGIQYSVLLTVVGGTELPVLARASDNVWFQVSTVIGVGWVNVQYTVPRGSFDNVPVVSLSDIFATTILPAGAITLALPDGQGGGGVSPIGLAASTAASTSPVIGGKLRVVLENNRVVTVSPGERFRAVLNVEAVNLRTQPNDSAPTLGTIFRDDTNDYTIVGNAKDKEGVDWIAIDVPDLGVGWIEAPKARIRLSRAAGTVMIVVADATALTDAPNGSGQGRPILSSGQEAFLTNISRDSNFVQITLGDGTSGWVPFNSVRTRDDTPTDQIDFSSLPAFTAPPNPVPGQTPVMPGTIPSSFGLDTPHIVINTGFLNIRSGPGAQYTIVTTVSGGTELPVIGIASDRVWFLVRGPFGQGWVNSEFTVFRGSIDAVAIIREAAIGILSNPVAIIAAGPITLYAAPGTNFGAIGSIAGPIEVPVVARTADGLWLQLSSSLGFGWVVASQITLRGDASLIPIVG